MSDATRQELRQISEWHLGVMAVTTLGLLWTMLFRQFDAATSGPYTFGLVALTYVPGAVSIGYTGWLLQNRSKWVLLGALLVVGGWYCVWMYLSLLVVSTIACWIAIIGLPAVLMTIGLLDDFLNLRDRLRRLGRGGGR